MGTWLVAIGISALASVALYSLLNWTKAGPVSRQAEPSAVQGPQLVNGAGRGALSPDVLYARCSPAVVQIVVADRKGRDICSGSGFLVGRHDLIATNYHVIEHAYTARALTADKATLPVLGVAALDEGADVAIVQVGGQMSAPPLELAGDGLPPVGAKVYAIGSPKGFTQTLSDGLVSGHREGGTVPDFPRLPTMIQTTAPISPGSSGGPLLTDDARVIGVTALGWVGTAQNLNFAVPASHVAGLLRRWKHAADLVPFPGTRKPEAVALYDRGMTRWKKEDRDEAMRDFDEAIRLDQNYALAYRARGGAWFAQRRYNKAIQDYSEAIRLDPEDTVAYCGRGNALRATQDFDGAVRDYSEAIRLDPSQARAYYGRGLVLFLQKSFDGAIRDYDAVIRLAPDKAPAYARRGDAWMLLNNFDQAIRDYDRAIQLGPDDANTYFGRGVAWSHKRDHWRAVRDFDMAILLDPKQATYYESRGRAWFALGYYDRGHRDFDKARQLNPWQFSR